MPGGVREQVPDLDAAGPLDDLVHVDSRLAFAGREVVDAGPERLPVELGIRQRGLAGHVRPALAAPAGISQRGPARVLPVVAGMPVELGGEQGLQVRAGGQTVQVPVAGGGLQQLQEPDRSEDLRRAADAAAVPRLHPDVVILVGPAVGGGPDQASGAGHGHGRSRDLVFSQVLQELLVQCDRVNARRALTLDGPVLLVTGGAPQANDERGGRQRGHPSLSIHRHAPSGLVRYRREDVPTGRPTLWRCRVTVSGGSKKAIPDARDGL